ncbi:MAG: exosome complex RNA-binding protein Csl4 [Nitrososphaerales archaeon]|nr:exosome complex RNA-binding protein Csl4 [Nitrososphaerales archaeon]
MNDKKNVVLPGDQVAVSEEYLPGAHVYDDSGLLRALSVGTVRRDQRSREISVAPAAHLELLKVGDYVTGQVESAATSTSSVAISYVNGQRTDKEFAGMLMLRSGRRERGVRGGPPVKLGDVVRCRIQSLLNGIIHLSIDEDKAGVVYAFCGNCGRPLQRGGNNRAKCDECGNVEERKLASDFGQIPIQP